jgi:hypothetical protein
MAVVAFLALALGLGFWILTPLMEKEEFQAVEYAAASELKDLLVLRDVAYDTLRDLEFDFRMGKMAEKDYLELKSRYQGEAAEILSQVEELEARLEKEHGQRARRAAQKKAPH